MNTWQAPGDGSLGAGFVSILLGILIGGFVIVRFFQKPVSELVEGTDRISKGDLSHTIPVPRKTRWGSWPSTSTR